MLVLDPKQPQSHTLVNHGVLYPADLTSAGDQVFVTNFDSHLITSFSVKNPEKIIFYEPTNPTLLSAGGIQVRVHFLRIQLCVRSFFLPLEAHLFGRKSRTAILKFLWLSCLHCCFSRQ